MYKTKALYELKQYEKCIESCNLALKSITNFHYNNDIWFKWRIAMSYKHLKKYDTALSILQHIAKLKSDWFIYKEISEIYFITNNYEKVLSFALKSALKHGDIDKKIHLIILLTKIFETKKMEYEAKLHFILTKIIIEENKWNIELPKTLLGYEGNIANIYFSAFDYLVNGTIKFEKRTRRPPKNEFNALLSFGYTILLNLVRTAVNIVGLDPYFGCYHSEEYGRPSMVLDLMEEFRPVAIDYLVINTLNKNIISKNDFIIDEENEELPVSLSIYGRKKYISLIEKRFNSYFWYEPKKRKMLLKDIVRYQAYLFAKAIIEDLEYVGYRF